MSGALNQDNVVLNADNIVLNFTSDVEPEPEPEPSLSTGPLQYEINDVDVTADLNEPFPITTFRGKDRARQYAPSVVGRSSLRVDNYTRNYTQMNSESPYYGQFPRGCPVAFNFLGIGGGEWELIGGGSLDLIESSDVVELIGSEPKTLWDGVLDDVVEDPDPSALTVDFLFLGHFALLRQKNISTVVYEGQTVSYLLNRVLDECGWPADKRDIQDSSVIIPMWVWDGNAFEAWERLRQTDGPGATSYERPGRIAVFENRDYRTTATRSTTPQATFIDEDYHVRLTKPSTNNNDVIDACTIQTEVRTPGPIAQIWQDGEDIVLAANQVAYRYIKTSEPFKNIQTPSAVGINAIQFVKSDQELDDGTVKLLYKGTPTVDLNWNATAGDVKAALETITGADTISVIGDSFNTGFYIYFEGLLKWQPIELLTVQSNLNPASIRATIQIIADDPLGPTQTALANPRPLEVGTFKFQYGAHKTVPINWDDTAAEIQTKVRLLGPGVFPGSSFTASGSGTIATDNISLNVDAETAPEGLLPIAIVEDDTLMASGQAGATLLVNHHQIGSGPDYVLSAGSVSYEFDRTSGFKVRLKITAGATGATITGREANTGLVVRAQIFERTTQHEASYPDISSLDPTERSNLRILPITIWPVIDRAEAESQAQMYVQYYGNPRTTTPVYVEYRITDPGVSALFNREISDRVRIINYQWAEDADYHIDSVELEWGSKYIIAKYNCERVIDSSLLFSL